MSREGRIEKIFSRLDSVFENNDFICYMRDTNASLKRGRTIRVFDSGKTIHQLRIVIARTRAPMYEQNFYYEFAHARTHTQRQVLLNLDLTYFIRSCLEYRNERRYVFTRIYRIQKGKERREGRRSVSATPDFAIDLLSI